MALEKTTFSLNLGNGIDQKSDNKVGRDDQFTAMKDWIYQKVGKLYKRFGTDRYIQTVSTTYPNPLSIGTSTIPSSEFAYKDQLCMQNKGALYSWLKDQSLWGFKGHQYPLEVTTETAVSSEYNYTAPTCGFINDLRIMTYQAVNINAGTNQLRYTIIEHSTGNILIDDVTIGVYQYCAIVTFSARVFLIYRNTSNQLFSQEINTTTGALGSQVVLQTDIANATLSNMDFVVTNKSGVGERAFIVYKNTSNFASIFAMTNAGIVDSSIPKYTSATASDGFGITYNTVSDILFVGYQTSSNYNCYIATFQFTSTTLVVWAAPISIGSFGNTVIAIDLCRSPINTAEVYFLFQIRKYNYYSNKTSIGYIDDYVYSGRVNATALVDIYLMNNGYRITSKSYLDADRSTIYSFVANTIGNQKTFFMVDRIKGKTDAGFFVQAKTLDSIVADPSTYLNTILSNTAIIGTKLYSSCSTVVDLIGDPPMSAPTTYPVLVERTGINEIFIELKPTLSGSYAFLGEATHSSGGYLGYYDGSTFCESNYFLQAELVEVLALHETDQRITINIVQNGSASVPEITQLTFFNAPLQLAGPTYYWTFTVPGPTTYVVYYIIDGVGTAPAAAGTKIAVSITGGMTSYDVMVATQAAIKSSLAPVATIITGNRILQITNNSNGSVAHCDGTHYVDSTTKLTTLAAGTYQYQAIYDYYDNNGQLIQSAPSPAVSVTLSTSGYVGAVCYSSNLTNRNISSIRTVWFRTTASGTLFYKVSAAIEDKIWLIGSQPVGYFDYKTDSMMTSSPELIYTTGNVLQNWQIPNCKQLSVFKNRIIASGMDNQTRFYYSKTCVSGSPVEFAEENFVQVDIDSDPITGHAQLDDKLIIFKKTKIYYLAGDGANDTGTSDSFSLPTLVATDVGCIGHNTIVKTPLGLMFKSQKGIYLLDRALQLTYIGKEVEDYNDLILMSGVLLPKDNQVRFTVKTGDALVYDYLFNRWTIFSQYYGDASCVWQDKYTRIDSDGYVYVENEAQWKDVGSPVPSYSPTFSTKWLQVKDMQQFSRIYRLAILGDLKSAHTLNYKLYYDYDDTNFDEYNFASSNITGVGYDDSVYQPIIHLKRQKCDAMLVKITCIPSGGTEESLQLVDMSFTVGLKQGLQKVRAEKKL